MNKFGNYVSLDIQRFSWKTSPYLTITETGYDVSSNTSSVKVSVSFAKSSTTYNSSAYCEGSYSGGASGSLARQTFNAASGVTSTYTYSWTISNIPHNDDGSLAAINFSVYVYIVSNTSATATGTYYPTTIPRASYPTSTSGNIEEAITIYTNRKSSSFTHTLTYNFGGLTGTIATGVGDSKAWTIPSSFYAKIPSAKSGTGTIYCTTYNGSTQVGSTQSCTFTAYASESKCKPTITGTAIDSNSTTTALTGDTKKFVKGYSNAKVTPTATAKNSATISKITLNGTTITGETTLSKVTSTSFVLQATDSRGFVSDSYTIPNLTLINYVPLTISPTAKRTNQTSSEIKVSYTGNYFNGSFGSVSNTLSVATYYKLSTDSSWTSFTASPTISSNTYSYALTAVSGTFPYTSAYDFKFVATDKLGSVTTTLQVTKGIPNLALFSSAISGTGQLKMSNSAFPTMTLTRSGSTNATGITFANSNGTLGAIGLSGSANGLLKRWKSDLSTSYDVLDRSVQTNNTSKTYISTGTNIPTINSLAYWNGAYNSSNSSNLTYCHEGTILGKNKKTIASAGNSWYKVDLGYCKVYFRSVNASATYSASGWGYFSVSLPTSLSFNSTKMAFVSGVGCGDAAISLEAFMPNGNSAINVTWQNKYTSAITAYYYLNAVIVDYS